MNDTEVKNYAVVSADAHCGATIEAYKDYLEREHHEEFDRWAASHQDAWADVDADSDAEHRVGVSSFASEVNWNSAKRQAAIEAEGIVAEVLFPNTTPPFYPSGMITAAAPGCPPEDRRTYELRLAGIRAHNRWVADFARELPGRRAAVAQVFMSDVADTLAEIKRAHSDGCKAILIPGDHFSSMQNVYQTRYEPVWRLLEELDMTLVRHTTAAADPSSDENGYGASSIALLASVSMSMRTMIELILSGVFERYPRLRFVTTELGASWAAGTLGGLDGWVQETRTPGTTSYMFAREMGQKLSLRPSEYFARNCYVGTFLSADDIHSRHAVGVDNIMWGADYPHHEGTWPYTREALRSNFAGLPEPEVRKMIGATAAKVYGFDLDLLQSVADRLGPSVDEINTPLAASEVPSYPGQTLCPTFAASPVYFDQFESRSEAVS